MRRQTHYKPSLPQQSSKPHQPSPQQQKQQRQ
jgi:hypothetical protein